MKTDTATIRRAVYDLDRAGLKRLASQTNIRTADLTDWSMDSDFKLTEGELARIEQWFEQHQLRRALERMPAAMAEGMMQATGIPDSHRDDFIANAATFTPDELTKATDYVSGRLGMPRATETTLGGVYIGLSLGEITERGALLNQLKALPTASLRALVNALPAKAAA